MFDKSDDQDPAADGKASARLEERVFADLVGRIRGGALSHGDKLPTEAELAADFGVSRPVVRSALAMLRDEGLLVSRQGSGSFVNLGVPDGTSSFAPLRGIDDISSVYRFRLLMECEGAALAAERATKADVEALVDLTARMETLAKAGAETVDADFRFHLAVANLSDNRFIAEGLEMLRPHVLFIARFVRTLGPQRYEFGKKKMNGEHSAIIDALAARDPKAARAAMRTHIERSQRRVFKGDA